MIDTLSKVCPQCGTDLTPLHQHQSSPSFCLQCKFPLMLVAGKYRFIKILGEGGFGTIYLAKHVHLLKNAYRVIKVLKISSLRVSGLDQRFAREIQLTAELSHKNEHIVRVYDDFGVIQNVGHFYVMEHLQGDPLSSYLHDESNLPPFEWVFSVFRQLCDAMEIAHLDGVIHRDLKPDNLLLVSRPKENHFLKILDFGIARFIREGSKLTQGALGTPFYMSPEQGMNRPADLRSDIYSMGVILYEMLTGRIPFVPPHMRDTISSLEVMGARMMKIPRHPCDIRPDRGIPRPVGDVILRALSKQVSERIQSAREFWKELQSALESDGSHSEKIVSLSRFSFDDDHGFDAYSALSSKSLELHVDEWNLLDKPYTVDTPLVPFEGFGFSGKFFDQEGVFDSNDSIDNFSPRNNFSSMLSNEKWRFRSVCNAFKTEEEKHTLRERWSILILFGSGLACVMMMCCWLYGSSFFSFK